MKQLIYKGFNSKTAMALQSLDDSISFFLIKDKDYLLQFMNKNVSEIKEIFTSQPHIKDFRLGGTFNYKIYIEKGHEREVFKNILGFSDADLENIIN